MSNECGKGHDQHGHGGGCCGGHGNHEGHCHEGDQHDHHGHNHEHGKGCCGKHGHRHGAQHGQGGCCSGKTHGESSAE